MLKYRKKPVIVEAIQWNGENIVEISKFIMESGFYKDGHFFIKTLEGEMIARKGDYIIKGAKGEIYPCKPDIFEMTYELIKE